MKKLFVLSCIASLLLPLTGSATQCTGRPQFEVVEIFERASDVVIYPGTLRLNNSHLVVGVSRFVNPSPHVETFLWQPGQPLQWRTGQIDDVNDEGAFIGSIEGAVMTSDYTSLRALAINNARQVAGQFQGRAFITDSNGQMTFPLGESVFSEARSINNSGESAGIALLNPSGPPTHVVFTSTNVIDLGWIRGTSVAETTAINDQGHVLFTVAYTNHFRVRSYLFRGNKPRVLPIRPGWRDINAFALNNSDEVVGISVRKNGVSAGFLYSGGRLYNLNKLLTPASQNWTISEARDINNSGSIAAFASRPGELIVPVLLRRVQQ